MNIAHLKLFIRIAQTHNISLAGAELGLSPAVASAHINKLEQGLGIKLIHRTTRKVSLTEEGKTFLPHAEDVLGSVDAARASVGAGSLTPQGTLRVTAPASFARMHLIPALKGFCDLYPSLQIDLRLSDSIIDMVEGGFDIAIRNAKLADSNLIARKLATDNRVVCASPNYLAQHGTPKTPNDLIEHQCVNLIGIEQWGFKHDDQMIKIKPQGNVRCDNGESVRDAAINDMGITLSSKWCVYQALKQNSLVTILNDYPVVSETAIWAVYPSSRLLAPKVRAFIDYFANYFGEQPYWDKT